MEKDTVFISDIEKFVNQDVILKGWIYNFRSSGKLMFLEFRDGTGFIQCVVSKNDVAEKVWLDCQRLTMESSVIIQGKVSQHPKYKDIFEVQLQDIEIIHLAQNYPIAKKEHGVDFLLDHRHLWLRSKKQWAIQRIRNTVINSIYEYFNKNGFIKIDAPILTPNACEGTTELFEIDYFEKNKAYLSQSGQLYLEAAIMAHNRVFDFGPVFRAEKSKTRRHLIEFWMMDAEMAFCDQKQNMQIQEELICFIVERVLQNNKFELKLLERDISPLEKIKPPFIYKTYDEVVQELKGLGSDIELGQDLGADDETMLMQKYEKPLFIQNYPTKIKAFYMKKDPNNPERVLCSDLLAPEGYGEIIGGSQREDDYDKLLQSIKDFGLDPEIFDWYLDLRKYGSVPHSGFGIGLERLTAWICGVKHIRETIPFPRLLNRIKP